MEQFDFDRIINRKGTNSIKYDLIKKTQRPEDTIPLWVADMDFVSPPEISEALKDLSAHGVYGYSETDEKYFNAVSSWMEKRHDWKIQPEWMIKTPGVVFGIAMAVRAFTGEGDSVLIQEPVYHPFRNTILANKRTVVVNELINNNGRYEINFEDFEKKIQDCHIRLFILCSPHNPVGRVWESWELEKMGKICLENDVIVISDEIHQDFAIKGKKHHIFTTVDPKFSDFSIVATAPSKTFNIPGLQASNLFVPNNQLKKILKDEIVATGYGEMNIAAIRACTAAYESGEEWLEGLKEYLEGNRALVRNFINTKFPKIHLIEPEGTYLLWLDFRELGTEGDCNLVLEEKAKVWMNRGSQFGLSGSGFFRMNIGCPRSVLEEALNRIAKAFEN